MHNIQKSLNETSFRKSSLKDVKWRVDHVIESSNNEECELNTQVQMILEVSERRRSWGGADEDEHTSHY